MVVPRSDERADGKPICIQFKTGLAPYRCTDDAPFNEQVPKFHEILGLKPEFTLVAIRRRW